MTLINMDMRRPAKDGPVPASGRMEWRPTARRTQDDFVVVPSAFDVQLVDGVASVDVAPSGPGWVWRVSEYVTGGATRYVTVPDVPTIAYTDLIDVDPATLEPSAAPDPAWWAEVDAIKALGGIPGETGPQGVPGEQGTQGAQGIPGDTGLTGPKGDKGDTGDTGPKGDTGDTGPAGADSTVPGPAGSPTAFELRGTGSPLGVVSASPGTYYTDTAGTNGAWRWLKKTGTGNAGWTVVYGTTGWRNIGTEVSWTGPDFLTGSVQVRRDVDRVRWRFKFGSATNPGGVVKQVFTAPSIPPEWLPFDWIGVSLGRNYSTPLTGKLSPAGALHINGGYIDHSITGEVSFAPLLDRWPTTLPGTPS